MSTDKFTSKDFLTFIRVLRLSKLMKNFNNMRGKV